MTNKEDCISQYILEKPVIIQAPLNQIRETISKMLPDCEERMSWKMPTYWKEHNIIHFAAYKKHIGLYPGPEAVIHFKELLTGYKTSKGAIQFPYDQPLPLTLIGDIAKWCFETGNHH